MKTWSSYEEIKYKLKATEVVDKEGFKSSFIEFKRKISKAIKNLAPPKDGQETAASIGDLFS